MALKHNCFGGYRRISVIVKTEDGVGPFLKTVFLKGPFPASFFILVFSIQLTVNNIQYKFCTMTGFEPRTSVVGIDCSTNSATTTALLKTMLLRNQIQSLAGALKRVHGV